MSKPASLSTLPDHAWVGIDLAQFEHNLTSLRARLAHGCRLCAVLKADAYGHGIYEIASVLIRNGVKFAAIASNGEASALRRAGYTGRILRIRTATQQEAVGALNLDIDELVGTPDVAMRLSALAWAAGRSIRVHVALNSGGMGRDGMEFTAPGGGERALSILALPGLDVVGIMTHFPDGSAQGTRMVLQAFLTEAHWLIEVGGLDRSSLLLHAASSVPTMELPESHLDMVRCGAALFGCIGVEPEFGPALTLAARVAAITELPAGSTVGYDRTASLTRATRLANIPLGYSNGYLRNFSNVGRVLIAERPARILGKVSMNSIMADVTDIPDAQIGETAVFFGKQGDLTISRDEVQDISGRILADLLCSWGVLNDRVYEHGGHGVSPVASRGE